MKTPDVNSTRKNNQSENCWYSINNPHEKATAAFKTPDIVTGTGWGCKQNS